MAKYAIGLDYGTLSLRALLIDISDGKEIATSVFEYPHGVIDNKLNDIKLPNQFALQDPQDYLDGLVYTIKEVIKDGGVNSDDIVGLGVDFTSSTILPVTSDGTPLCLKSEYKNRPHAYVKLWKHHGANSQASHIDEVIASRNEKWIELYGGKTSSEFMFPKILETLENDEDIYNNAAYFLEALDWITWQLTGIQVRSSCGAGYKAFYRHDLGYPSKEFFKAVNPRLENVVADKLNAPIYPVGKKIGNVNEKFSKLTGLSTNCVVATGIIDAHSSLLGAGINTTDTLMIIVGTSSCHMMLSNNEIGIKGVGGLVLDGIVPGYFGYEAGQCCVGDHFDWFAKNCVPQNYIAEANDKNISIHKLLREKLKDYKTGSSGLLALDWFNGVRSPLMDFDLNGLILGLNLNSRPEEIYLSLIEATAYGTRVIIDSFLDAGIKIKEIVLSGGIPKKDQLLVQVYADVCRLPIRICASSQASALGAAILGVNAADHSVTGYKNIEEIISNIGKVNDEVIWPIQDNSLIYDDIYTEYKKLSNYFNKENNVMKKLNNLKNR